MPRYAFTSDAHPALLTELIAAGLPPETPVELGDGMVWVTADEADEAIVAATVAAHDPTVYEAAEEAARHTYQQAIDYLRGIYQQANADITIDEAKNAIKALTVLARTQHQQLAEDT